MTARLADGARLEWLPLETIAYSGCKAHNTLRFELAPGAQMIGWDVLALGLPAAGQSFNKGRFLQHLELPGVWLERGAIDAADTGLLDSALGWAGRRVLATLWFAGGAALPQPCHEALLASAREQIEGDALLAAHAGATLLQERVVVLRVLAPRVEPAMQLLTKVRAAWRHIAWVVGATAPRVLNINAGARATIWKGLFADFRIEYRYDSTPDAGPDDPADLAPLEGDLAARQDLSGLADMGARPRALCGSSAFCWEYPAPQGNWLSSVFVLSPSAAWIAGESGTIPVPAAIASAVEDALRKRNPNAMIDRLPITSDRIVELLSAEH